ncbi:PaaX family transcriptional regulator [Thiolinea disciformis]|uniref:PaaX family transcriptional regulator n=1 Tax=Thiolinea disciformis TaxID=125614 RepID=UPI000369ADA4|nr:PaaX family transcriptional regulator C-terminal domain-containing protein [Thiolinea disciformis]
MNLATFHHTASEVVEAFKRASPIHANTLILTIYGDMICPHGGTIWLGSLIKLTEPLGISQRLVRTSVFRLAEKKILRSRQIGRRSYYSLTERGQRQFASAAQRIYAAQLPTWDGQWRLVLTQLGELDNEQREAVRKELLWLGFTLITNGVFAHPSLDLAVVKQMAEDMQVSQHLVMLRAYAHELEHLPTANQLIKNCFNVQAFEEEYEAFHQLFSPVLQAALAETTPLDPQLCFLIRTLLILKYRRILLREPELPHELAQAESWSSKARSLTAQLYQTIAPAAEQYFLALSETEKGKFAQPNASYYQRFLANH